MVIRLKEIYQGTLTNEQPILPGDYAEDDEQLFGLAEYLVSNGHAITITEDEAAIRQMFHVEDERQTEAQQLERETELVETANRNRVEHDEALRTPRNKKRNT